MLFPTQEFLLFFSAALVLSWVTRPQPLLHRATLLVLSLIFYGWWDFRLVPLLVTTSLAAWMFALLLGLPVSSTNGALARKKLHRSSIILFLTVLALFKYQLFLVSHFNTLLLSLGFPAALPAFDAILPVGISFYLFQMMSYVTDVYRGEYPPRRSPLDVMLYVSFFPQLVAGPIVRGSTFFPQLEIKKRLRDVAVSRALILIGVGLLKKMVAAHYLAVMVVDPAFENPAALSGWNAWTALYAYGLQIYCDFSAYSDMAVGTALLLGYDFPMNFNKPLGATSLQDFWRRWHMTLSTWLRDYLYIPLGGSHGSGFATFRNLMLTMLLGGLWHGSSWNFAVWGGLHGFALGVERGLRTVYRKAPRFLALFRPLAPLVTFQLVNFTWLFFRSPDWETSGVFASRLFSPGGWEVHPWILVLAVPFLGSQWLPDNWRSSFSKWAYGLGAKYALLFLLLVFLIVKILRPIGVAPFIYFQF